MGQLQLIHDCVPEEKWNEVDKFHKEKGFIETVLYVYDNIFTEDQKLQAEKDVKNKKIDSKYYKLLYTGFNMKEHYDQVDSHKHFVKKAYNRLKDFVPNMQSEDAENHDLSKYDFSQAVGYTARWVHMLENESWQKALEDHYKREPHHPQYFGSGRMPRKYLEESLIDMVGSRWERILKGDENAKNVDLVDFDPKYLIRYNKEDFDDVLALINKIKES